MQDLELENKSDAFTVSDGPKNKTGQAA